MASLDPAWYCKEGLGMLGISDGYIGTRSRRRAWATLPLNFFATEARNSDETLFDSGVHTFVVRVGLAVGFMSARI